MNKEKLKEILLVICVSYTIISIGIPLLESILAGKDTGILNQVNMLLWTAIAVSILYTHPMFDRLSPLGMILLQYIAAQGLVFLTVWLGGLFVELHEQAYFHVFRSFSSIYVIGAAAYYIGILIDVRKQNRLLSEIKASEKNKG